MTDAASMPQDGSAAHTTLSRPLSFRDPHGFVVNAGGRILRAVALDKAQNTRELLSSPWMRALVAEGSIPMTTELVDPPPMMEGMDRWLWLEHEPLPFPCYPHEITALQLYDAGQLTLKIASLAARHGWLLKDASSLNVLFSRGRPVFVDLLSFEKRVPGQPWIAYGQFARHFVLPLMLNNRLAITPADIFLVNRDGISPERAYQLLPTGSLVSLRALEFILLPRWLQGAGTRAVETGSGVDHLASTLNRLSRALDDLRPDPGSATSAWRNYEEQRLHYTDADLAAKIAFVRQHIPRNGTVLDLGCNAGEFSQLAAESGNAVVAADFDHPALGRLYQRIRGQGKPITPVLLNIGRPTPAIGWDNRETESFLDRAAGQFNCLLVLGLIHHLLVTERVPLPMLLDLLLRLKPSTLIIEWVDPADPKFRQVAGLNAALYSHLSATVFEQCFEARFSLREKLALPCGTRVMYQWAREYS